jgi:ADP-ribose pyrophosphatase
MMIETLEKNILLKNNYFTVENNKVLFKGKKVGEHLRIIPTVEAGIGVLPITTNGEIIIQDEYRYSYGDYITQIVKGGIKEGQTPEEAVYMELEEELSIKCEELIPLGKFVEHPSIVSMTGFAYLAFGCEPKHNALNEEETECFSNKKYIKFSDMLKKVMNNEIDCAVTQMVILKAYVYLLEKGELEYIM